MKSRRRWMKSVLEDAQTCKVRMPWERGLRRQAMINRRQVAASQATAVTQAARRAAAG